MVFGLTKNYAGGIMAHIVIIGAGVAGVSVAQDLRATGGDEHAITLINESDCFYYSPSLNWFSIGWRDEDDICFSLSRELAHENINILPVAVTGLDAKQHVITLIDGSTLSYDYLVLATGARNVFSATERSSYCSFTSSFLDAKSTVKHYFQFMQLSEGEIVILATDPSSHLVNAYETVFIIDADLKRRKIRNKFNLSLVTSEQVIGELGLNGVGDSIKRLQSALQERNINTFQNTTISSWESDSLIVEAVNSAGACEQTKFHAPFVIDFPSRTGVDVVTQTQGLCDERGFVLVDEYQRSYLDPQIYAVGDCVALPKMTEGTVHTVNTSELMVESMVKAITQNICSELLGLEVSTKFKQNAIGIIDMGEHAASFAAIPISEPRETSLFEINEWLHISKQNFEVLTIEKLRSGDSTGKRERAKFEKSRD